MMNHRKTARTVRNISTQRGGEEEMEKKRNVPREEEDQLPDFHIYVHGVSYPLNMKSMASRCSKIATVLETRPLQPRQLSLRDIPADAQAFELAAGFCHGRPPKFSPESVVAAACVAAYLGMTEEHSPGNLLNRALVFFSSRVLPHWDETICAFRSAEPVMPYARRLGMVDACLCSIAEKVADDHRLLGNPEEELPAFHGSQNNHMVSAAKRRAFSMDTEDLVGLPLDLYVLAMGAVAGAPSVPSENVAWCLYQYAKRWADVGSPETPADEEAQAASSAYESENNSRRRVIEAVEKLLPRDKGSLPTEPLFQMLQSAISLRASQDCREGFEARIGKILAEASLRDLFIPTYGYATETKHDVECIRRILIHFCSNYYTSPNTSELITVTELFQEFVEEVVKDTEMEKETFTSLLEMLAGLVKSVGLCTDGVYAAADAYLDAHGHLTESEREAVCRALDCRRLSLASCEHAAQNERMPLRVVAAALFVGQMRIREAITGALQGEPGEREDTKEDKGLVMGFGGSGKAEEGEGSEGERRREDEGAKESEVSMRSEAKRETLCRRCGGVKKKLGFWKDMKRRLGCGSSLLVCNCSMEEANP